MNDIQTLIERSSTMNQNIWEKHERWRKKSPQNEENREKYSLRTTYFHIFYCNLLKRRLRIHLVKVYKHLHVGKNNNY